MSKQSETSPRSLDPGRTAVILLNFGGPRSLDEVRPFLKRIFSDGNVIPIKPAFLRHVAAWFFSRTAAKVSVEKYRLIGGHSPLVEITLRQASSLQEELARRGKPMKVYAGMRYGAPEIRDAVLGAISGGAQDFVVVPLYPHYSITTTGSAFARFAEVIGKVAPLAAGDRVTSYESHPAYIEALSGKLRAALQAAGEDGQVVTVVFSAHSLPAKLHNRDALYNSQVKTTAGLVAQSAGVENYEFAYQSGREGWLGPSTVQTLEKLASSGCRSVVVVPLSFTCDNIETLYDIDIKLKAEADRLGVVLRRTESLNDSPAFIGALADIVLGYHHRPPQ